MIIFIYNIKHYKLSHLPYIPQGNTISLSFIGSPTSPQEILPFCLIFIFNKLARIVGDKPVVYEFIKKTKFEHLGIFTYSDEDDTVGQNMFPKVRQSTMDKRRDALMSLQLKINTERLNKLIGKNVEAIVDHYDEDINMYALRYYAQALDDVDGYIYVKHKYLEIGEFYNVTIIDIDDYDLIGEIKKED